MRKERIWRWWLAAGLVVLVGYFMLPTGSLQANLVYDFIGLSSGLTIIAAVRVHRPARPGMWYWFAGGQIISVAGDLVYGYYDLVLHQQPYPSPADALYLASYPMIATGLVILVRRRRGRGAHELIDAAIIAVGLGLAFWVFVLHPIAAGSASSTLERWISTTYPAADVLLLAMLARLFAGGDGRSASARLISLATVLMFAADVAYSLVSLYWDADLPVINAGYLISYLCWAAAALHPSMAGPAAAPGSDRRVRLSRLSVFAGCSMLVPALLLVPEVGGNAIDRRAVAVGAILLFLLVIVRLAGSMGKVQRQSADLERLAMADDLTGLANRRWLESLLSEASSAGRPQLAVLGLNGFKNVNDELGRPVGDRVLAALAGRIAAAAPDAVVARTGGDEFAVLLADASADEARQLADRLVDALRPPVADDGRELLVGVSIGLAGGAATDPVELLREAEVAMYAAKRTGEPVRRWTPKLDERSTDVARLGAELRAALDAGQFRVVYQPIVELPAGRVTAVEALVRWEHPERGLVSPADFIPVAEQNGLIVELGAWIMRTACARLAAWRRELGAAAPDRVSVNVSARQLARHGFADTVAVVLAEAGLPAECLTVEVTETAVFEGGAAVAALHELRALGVRIALDDFGTGHSSLGLLQTVPVHTLKVDKSFVDNITASGQHAVIAEALIRISRGLGLSAVAEGVETAEQAAALSRLGYRYLQGYHYGRPVADPDFALVGAVSSGHAPAAAHPR